MIFFVGAASAHRPWFNLEGSQSPSRPYVLEDIAVSQVVYGGFSEAGRVDYFKMTVPDGFAADLQIVVPDVAACSAFRPAYVIAGPGISTIDELPAGVDFKADIDGWMVVSSEEWGSFFEPFTRTTYATSPRFLELLEGGDYLIAVVEPDGDTGTYGLALGGSENFGGDPRFLERIGPIDDCIPPPVAASPEATPAS